jgi:hypothetical protein
MTPEQKAEELIGKFSSINIKDVEYPASELATLNRRVAKECALIAVDEILSLEKSRWSEKTYTYRYYMEVKQVIEEL